MAAIPRQIINVRMFGARGDFTGDNTNSINAAIQFIAHKGGVVRIPIGKYRLTDKLNIRGMTSVVLKG